MCFIAFGIEVKTETIPVDSIYSRDSWMTYWLDVDKDGQNTRMEVLVSENNAIGDSTVWDGVKIISGKWLCYYTNRTFTNPTYLDIDHTVPLKEAWLSGGWKWDKTTRKLYANYLDDPRHLNAVYLSANRSKSDSDPAKWMPQYNKCTYLKYWTHIKSFWNLSMDSTEYKYVKTFLNDSCGCNIDTIK